MSAVWLFLRGVPWQVWGGAAAIVIMLVYGQMRYNKGWNDAVAKVAERQQRAKADADRELDRLRGGDASRVRPFDRD